VNFSLQRFNLLGRGVGLSARPLAALDRMSQKRDLCPWPGGVFSTQRAASGLQNTGIVVADTLVMTPSRGAAATVTIVASIHRATAQGVGTFAAVTAGHVLALTLPAVPGVHAAPYGITVPFAGTEAALGDFITTLNDNADFSYALTAQDNGGGKMQFVSKYGGTNGFTVLSHANGSDSDVLASLGFTDANLAAAVVGGVPNVANSHSIAQDELAALANAAGIPCFVGASPEVPADSVLFFPLPRGQTATFSGAVATALGLPSGPVSLLSGLGLGPSLGSYLSRPRPVRVGERIVLLP